MLEITSAQNKAFKRYKSLLLKKNREEEGLFLLEGRRYVDTALQSNRSVETLLFSSTFWETLSDNERTAYSDRCSVTRIADELFKELVHTEQSQGVLGIMQMPKFLWSLTDIRMEDEEDILLLDRIQDPGNLGTIIRTADATGIRFILLSKGTVDPFNPKVLRSTAGSILNVRLVMVESYTDTLTHLKSAGFSLLSTALEGARDYDEDGIYGSKNCLIIGNEANGISPELLEASDTKIKLPIIGMAESLNASVAAGVMMYKLLSVKRKRIF